SISSLHRQIPAFALASRCRDASYLRMVSPVQSVRRPQPAPAPQSVNARLKRRARAEKQIPRLIGGDRAHQLAALLADGGAEGAFVLESLDNQHAVAARKTTDLAGAPARAHRLRGEIETDELRHV